MGFWNFFVPVYFLVTVFAVYKTYQEQKRRRISSPLFNLLGYVFCVLWPLAFGILLVAVRFDPANRKVTEFD